MEDTVAGEGVIVVGVASAVGPENVRRIAAVSERVRVIDLAPLLYQEFSEARRPGQTPPPPYTGTATLAELVADVEALLAARALPEGFIALAPRLCWVQAVTAATQPLAAAGLQQRTDILWTSGAGVNSVPVAEWALTMMLVMAKHVPRLVRAQDQRRWERLNLGELHGKTVGIIGLGPVGRVLARLLRPFNVRVLGLRRTPGAAVPDVDEVLPPERLPELLSRSDFVVIAAPLTDETRGMINAAALRQMQPSAYLINAARGALVDEPALIEALQANVIAGAALDVFWQEPLPPDSPLWELPNAFLTPHVAGVSEMYDTRVTDLFIENLTRYLAGEPLLGLVDRERGY